MSLLKSFYFVLAVNWFDCEKQLLFWEYQTLLLVFVKFALKMSRVINPNKFFCSAWQNSGSESFKV